MDAAGRSIRSVRGDLVRDVREWRGVSPGSGIGGEEGDEADGGHDERKEPHRGGRAAYALRKQTVEPVFGIIKSVMGFRQFLLRGLDNVRNEWTLVCLAWNLKRMAVLRPQ